LLGSNLTVLAELEKLRLSSDTTGREIVHEFLPSPLAIFMYSRKNTLVETIVIAFSRKSYLTGKQACDQGTCNRGFYVTHVMVHISMDSNVPQALNIHLFIRLSLMLCNVCN